MIILLLYTSVSDKLKMSRIDLKKMVEFRLTNIKILIV